MIAGDRRRQPAPAWWRGARPICVSRRRLLIAPPFALVGALIARGGRNPIGGDPGVRPAGAIVGAATRRIPQPGRIRDRCGRRFGCVDRRARLDPDSGSCSRLAVPRRPPARAGGAGSPSVGSVDYAGLAVAGIFDSSRGSNRSARAAAASPTPWTADRSRRARLRIARRRGICSCRLARRRAPAGEVVRVRRRAVRDRLDRSPRPPSSAGYST